MHRNTTLLFTLAVLLVGLTVPATQSKADAATVYEMYFPIIGDVSYSDTWGAARSGGRSHTGTDIMGAKMLPVIAVASGTIYWMHDNQGGNCCAMGVRHDDGWTSYYIHLNNDTPGTDDGQGWGFAPGIEVGTHVEAGELIGYVGDSGNAEWTASHLHYELHQPDGTKINPYLSLLAAEVLSTPLDEDAERLQDEVLFYKTDGVFKYYKINPNGTLESPVLEDDDYSTDWSAITAIDLDGDGQDEIFFYREDGTYSFHNIESDATLGPAILDGTDYTQDWSSVTAIDLDGDGSDEMFFYREDGLFRYYDVNPNGSLGQPILAGDKYTSGWSSITAVDLDGDGQDEMFFYREDGLFRYYNIGSNGSIGSPINAGSGYSSGWASITAVQLDN